MNDRGRIIYEAINNNEFSDCLTGKNGYIERDRFDPNTINYQAILGGLYSLNQEKKELNVAKLFYDFLFNLDYSQIENIYIVTLYLFEIYYSELYNENTFAIDDKSISRKLTNAVNMKKEELSTLDEIRSLGVFTNVLKVLCEFEVTCFNDTSKHIFEIK